MSVDLNKHRDSIIAAWNDVLDENSDTNWALFGYDGQSNDLKFVSKGDGGLEELVDELNSNKIMYAFLKVDVPDASVTKNVLINWQGEAAPTIRKGSCANHIAAISRTLPAHLTLHARTEDDLDEKHIVQQLAKAGSNFNFKATKGENDSLPPTGPVGTTYKKVNPGAEINSRERDEFWSREEQEEKKRREAERQQKAQEKRIIEEDIKRRKENEETVPPPKEFQNNHQQRTPEKPARSSLVIQRINSITKQSNNQEYEKTNDNKQKNKPVFMARQTFEQNIIENNKKCIESKRDVNVEKLRNKKESETKDVNRLEEKREELIKTSPLRNIDKIALSLERPSQIQHEPLIDAADLSPDSASEPMHRLDAVEGESETAYSSSSNDDDERFSTIKRSPHANVVRQDTVIRVQPAHQGTNGNGTLEDLSPESENVYEDLEEDPGLTARALYDYQAADETEISFEPGEVITHIEQIDPGWWQGLSPNGTFGLFPANYVQLLS